MSAVKTRVLIVDDDSDHAEVIAEAIERTGYDPVTATSGEEGLAALEAERFDIVITDLMMKGVDGMQILREARQRSDTTEVVLVTGYGSVETAVEAMREGAAHYITKPVNLVELRTILAKTVEKQALKVSNIELRQQLDHKFGFEKIVGNSKPMTDIFKLLRQVAPTNATVLIQGESGTGKELIAKAVHNNSPRKSFPFVAINCAALSEGIIESELFGHEKGAFTGAAARKLGKFEYAHGGTLFLDEVGDMPLTTQMKLLRVLEEREIVRVGSNQPIPVDVRLLSATNMNLVEAVGEGRFREDLYFRLRVISISLPPLRERPGDIPLLVDAFVAELSGTHGREIRGVSPETLAVLSNQRWPGNVRELRNVLENMVITSRSETLQVSDIPAGYLEGAGKVKTGLGQLAGIPLEEVEKECISQTLALVDGNRERTARMLGIGERTLYRKITQYGLRDST
jgi:two-component system, NtrC family, response regulator HydG